MSETRVPQISIIIPVYNSSRFLGECLDTVCGQTLKNIEIICVDDGSTDNSIQILQKYAKNDKRFKLLYHVHTGNGAAGARNMGLEYASGEYVLFLDSDDWFELDLAEKTYLQAKKVNADVVIFDGRKVDNSTGKYFLEELLRKKNLPQEELFSWDDYPDYIFQTSIGTAWMLLCKRKFIQKEGLKFQEVYHSDDVFFTYSVFACAKRITIVQEKLVYYRINHSGSQTDNRIISPLSSVKAALKLQEWLKGRGLYEKFRKSFINWAVTNCMWYADGLMTLESFSELFYYLKNHALKTLDLLDTPKEEFYALGYFRWCHQISKFTLEEYLFDRLNSREVFRYESDQLFPSIKVKEGDKIILYGAGNVGKSFYIQNLIQRHCDIVLWADRDFEKMGNLVKSIDEAENVPYDRVLVAVEKRNLYEEIKRRLIEKGIGRECIIWAFE